MKHTRQETPAREEQSPAPAYVPLPPGTVRDPEAMEDTAAGPDEGDEQYW